MSYLVRKCLLGLLFVSLIACSGSKETEPGSSSKIGSSFPALPKSTAEVVTIEGKMVFWMFEGDGGCFGTIRSGVNELELWVDADTCGEVDYAENEDAALKITYDESHQYGRDTMYTIVGFL